MVHIYVLVHVPIYLVVQGGGGWGGGYFYLIVYGPHLLSWSIIYIYLVVHCPRRGS